MNPLIVIGIIVAVPTLLILLSRTKAALVFMALCVGSVLSTFVGDAALDMVQLFTRSYSPAVLAGVQIGLLTAPALLTMLFLNRTLSGSKVFINVFPALLTGVMTLYFITPLLPDAVRLSVIDTEVWQELSQYQAIVVGTAVLLSLGQLWAGGAAARHKKQKKKH